MSKRMHRNTCLSTATSILVIASQVIFFKSKISTLWKFPLTSILTYFSILMKPCLQRIWRKSHCRPVYINKHCMCTDIAQRITCSNKCKSLCKNLIILLYTNKKQTHMQSISTTYTHNSLLCTCVFCHILLEAIHKLTY